jgi:RNA polymerase sigma factor (sigma-70 family)
MKKPYFWVDKGLLWRQIAFAWLSLFVSVIFFLVVALGISTFTNNDQKSIVLSFLVTFPILIGTHIIVRRNNYYLKLPFIRGAVIKPKVKEGNLHDLLVRISEGHKSAREDLYDEINKPLSHYIKKHYSDLLTSEDADEIKNQAILTVLLKASFYRGTTKDSARNWIYAIARRQAEKWIKTTKVDNTIHRSISINSSDDVIHLKELDSLSETDRNILILFLTEELSFEQIAAILDISTAHIGKTISKILVKGHQ